MVLAVLLLTFRNTRFVHAVPYPSSTGLKAAEILAEECRPRQEKYFSLSQRIEYC